MKFNKWTTGLAAAGVISLASAARAQDPANLVTAAVAGTSISGYVDVSAQWNPGTGNANLPCYPFSAGKADGFNLNVAQVSVAKPLDDSSWAAGFCVDLWLGPDAKTLGTSSYLGLANVASDLAIRQAYVNLRTPLGSGGIYWKLGVFDTIIGSESLSSFKNPHYTRSYGFGLEPTTHTGLLATYEFGDFLDVSLGVANTIGPSINERAFPSPIPVTLPYGGPTVSLPLGGDRAESYKTYMGSVALKAPESFGFLAGSGLYAGVINGFGSTAYETQTSWYVGSTLCTPVSGLKFGVAYDYLDIRNNNPDAWAVAFYTSIQATEKLSFLARIEGVKYPDNSAFNAHAITFTTQYDLWQNLLSRIEVRWDHCEHGQLYGGTGPSFSDFGSVGDFVSALGGTPPNRENAFMVAANLIYRF
jgi:hypothetical protein